MPTYYYEDRDLYFVRVPKTGSASIMSLLGKPTKSYWDAPHFPTHSLEALSPTEPIKTLAFVRHPVERFRSALGMWRRRLGTLEVADALVMASIDPPEDPKDKAVVHFTPMTHPHFGIKYICPVYRYEDLQDVWPLLSLRLGLPTGTQLPHLREEYTKPDLTKHEEELVRARYAVDLHTFWYD